MPRYDFVCPGCDAKEERDVPRAECKRQTCTSCSEVLEIELSALSVAPGLTVQSNIKLKDGRRLPIPYKLGRRTRG